MAIAATYVNESQFTVAGDTVATFRVGTRIRLNMGVDGNLISDVAASAYQSGPDTTLITAVSSALTSNLVEIERGHTFCDPTAGESNFSQHFHTDEWDGGYGAFSLWTSEGEIARLQELVLVAPSVVNFLYGVNGTGDDIERKELLGTTDQVDVTHGVGSITLSLPQEIAIDSDVEFGSIISGTVGATSVDTDELIVSGLSGIIVADGASACTSLAPPAPYSIMVSNAGGTAMEWVSYYLDSLIDVSTAGATLGQVLTWSGSVWAPEAPAGGSGGGSGDALLSLILSLPEVM